MEVTPNIPQVTKIICSNFPDELLEKDLVKEHFSQFGKVNKIHFRRKNRSWALQYEAIEDAEAAILKGGEYMGKVFDVQWGDKTTSHGKRRVLQNADQDWLPDLEIRKELEAMGSMGGRVFKQKYHLRPEDMAVDSPFPAKHVKETKINWKTTPKRKRDVREKSPAKKRVSDNKNKTIEEIGLLSIIKQPAVTVEEKYRLLDARDKLIRLKTKKSLDITEAIHFIGTCPDMCPEKERLMRVIQHQVALYEQDAGGRAMNPALAVKQYSRSSADQEVPLPHELRPVLVLQFTMGYLMHYIMNLGDSPDVNIAEWYHFLWDRTRGIRKDITQQALCSHGSVVLLEQCARFHIHCSARLVAEDTSVFDHRINTENLTKCLQTLKYMYHDLHIKGESCPNEAEFRAYIILLNLNDGNFMWEVQRLEPEIQKSREVRFAMQVYSSLDQNNYIKFFKLVHSTTYLNACLLLRYFLQVRTKALSILVRCYSPRASYTPFSLTELETLLAFEDLNSVKEFLLSFGLYFNETNTHVVLDRKRFTSPLIPYILDRAVLVVESKRQTTVGETVCGDSLPPPLLENYVPFNSFTENGTFIVPDILQKLIEGAEHKVDEPDLLVMRETVDTDSRHADYKKTFWSVTTDSSTSVKNTTESPVSKSIFGTTSSSQEGFSFKFNTVDSPNPSSIFSRAPITNSEKSSENIFGSIAYEPTSSAFKQKQFSFRDVSLPQNQRNIFELTAKPQTDSEREMQLTKEKEQQLIHQQNEARLKAEIEKKRRKILEQLELEKQKQLEYEKRKQYELEVRQLHELEKKKQLELEKQKLLEIEKQNQFEKEKSKQLELEKQKQLELQRKKLIEIEKRRTMEKQRELERKQIEDEKLKQQQKLQLLEKERQLNEEIKHSVKQLMDDLLIKVVENYKEGRLKEISESCKRHKLRLFIKIWHSKIIVRRKKRQAIDQNPIWMPSRSPRAEADELFTSSQSLSLQNIKRYKFGQPLNITLPHIRQIEKINMQELYKLLIQSHTKLGLRAQREIFWKVTVSLPNFQEFRNGLHYIENILTDFFDWKERYGTTAVVGKLVGEPCFHYSVEKKQGIHLLDGNSNGLIFIMNEITDTGLKRISSSLKAFPNMARIPIGCVLINNNFAKNIDLQKLKYIIEEDKHVNNCTILCCKYNESSIIVTVNKCLEFLINVVENPPPLELDTLEQFLLVYLASELWEKVSTYSTWNYKYRQCLKLPNVVIDLYNDAVEKLKEIITDTSSLEYQDFCDDFDLISQVPDSFPCNYRYFPPFWKLDSYRHTLLTKMESLTLPRFNYTWPPETQADLEELLLHYLSEIFKEPQTMFYKVLAVLLKNIDPLKNFCDIENVSWVDIITVLALEKINEIDFSLRYTEFHTKSVFQELVVVYDIAKVEAYNYNEWFYLKNPIVQCEVEKTVKSKNITNVEQQPPDPFTLDFDLDKLERSLREDNDDSSFKRDTIKSDVEEMGMLLADLEESMKIHKAVCSHFQTTLTTVLSGNSKK